MDNEKFQKLVLQKLEQINHQMGEHTHLLRALEHANEVRKAEVDNLIHSVARIEGNIQELRQGQDELRKGQDGIRKELDELRQGQDELRNGQKRIESSINEIKEDNRSIQEIIGEHEVSIRTLRRHSV